MVTEILDTITSYFLTSIYNTVQASLSFIDCLGHSVKTCSEPSNMSNMKHVAELLPAGEEMNVIKYKKC